MTRRAVSGSVLDVNPDGAASPVFDETAARKIFDELCSRPWSFHGWSPDVHVDWGLNRAALERLYELVPPGARTLETGAGLSTIVFALKRARHTVVSPFRHEHDRIKAWCTDRGVPLDGVTFVARPSQDALPEIGDDPLDVVLIDGDHAFPAPFIDWYYAARRLVVGGLLIVDDTQVKTGRILRDFLRKEEGRWRVRASLPTTEVFERIGQDLVPDVGWIGQPYCARARLPLAWRVRSAWPALRAKVRLRTRLRALVGSQSIRRNR